MDDKLRILDYMKFHTHGVRNAKPRHFICEALNIEDREFRELCESLKDEGHIASDSENGYWFIPLVLGNDPIEIAAVRRSMADYRSRGVKLLNRANKMGLRLEGKITKQQVFA